MAVVGDNQVRFPVDRAFQDTVIIWVGRFRVELGTRRNVSFRQA